MTGTKPSDVHPSPPARPRRNWRMFLAGAATAWIIPLVIAFIWGPRSTTRYEDPLTGRTMEEGTWMGLTLYSHVEENEVSKWAERNSLPGVYPAQYGWSPVSSHSSRWFDSTKHARGGYGIPAGIYREALKIEGLVREETLQKYQAELIAAYHEHGSTLGIQKRWRERRE